MEKKRTLKQIQEDIKSIENQINDIKDIRKHRPELVALEAKIRKIKDQYQNETKSQISCWESDIEALKKELKGKKEENQIQLSERVKNWFHNYLSGVNFGYNKPKIVWLSPDERFAIITSPGGTAGTGTPMGSMGYYYAQSSHWLTEIVEGGSYVGNRYGGKASIREMEHEGRLTKEMKAKMIARAEEIAGYKFEK